MNRNQLVQDVIAMLQLTEAPFFTIGNCYYHKRICVDLNKGRENVFDTSTDIWRPLNKHELEIIIEKGFARANNYLVIKNSRIQLAQNRKDFHIATIKKNEKDKMKYFNRAIEAIKKLKELLGYQHES